MDTQYEDGQPWSLLLELPERFKTVEARETDVQHHDVPRPASNQTQKLRRPAGFADRSGAAVGQEDVFQTSPDDGVVITDEDVHS